MNDLRYLAVFGRMAEFFKRLVNAMETIADIYSADKRFCSECRSLYGEHTDTCSKKGTSS